MPVVVEDATSSASVTLRVQPHITIGTLKEQVYLELGFPPQSQRWIIGQSLCRDGRSLSSYGIRHHGDPAFLFLLPAATPDPHGLLRALGMEQETPGTGNLHHHHHHHPHPHHHPAPSSSSSSSCSFLFLLLLPLPPARGHT
ncbi:sharpin [Parus major]|uniref:sharpin n=1 Tax=Parus major TaxID=9157 RepID=UPI0007713213|nr:sharpin [Parus major]